MVAGYFLPASQTTVQFWNFSCIRQRLNCIAVLTISAKISLKTNRFIDVSKVTEFDLGFRVASKRDETEFARSSLEMRYSIYTRVFEVDSLESMRLVFEIYTPKSIYKPSVLILHV